MKVLVLAKAPVPGQVKTRLGADIGHDAAAEVAACALLDTLIASAAATDELHLALAGDLGVAVRGEEIRDALVGWSITAQRGTTFAQRLVNAHLDAGPGIVAQIGMDTPHMTPTDLAAAFAALDGPADSAGLGDSDGDSDAVLGPALDGGWWVLVRRHPDAARALIDVPMSTPRTYAETRSALEARGLRVATTGVLRDVDTIADADAVAVLAPNSRFASAWTHRTSTAVPR